MPVGVLLLAAGSSRRFGGDKRQALLADGSSLLQHTISRIQRAELPLLVCLGAADNTIADQLNRQGIACLICQRSSEGMGATLAEGVTNLPDWSGVIIALADMPWVRSNTLRALADALTEQAICVPCYREQRGNPVGFGAAYFSQLVNLGGDSGARNLLRTHTAAVLQLDVDDPGILRDVDRREDLPVSSPTPE